MTAGRLDDEAIAAIDDRRTLYDEIDRAQEEIARWELYGLRLRARIVEIIMGGGA